MKSIKWNESHFKEGIFPHSITYSSASDKQVSSNVLSLFFSSLSFKMTLLRALGFFLTGASLSLPLLTTNDASKGLAAYKYKMRI